MMILALLFTFGVSAQAESSNAPLRWGADVESGAPYAYKDPKNPDRVIGFEAEIMAALAKEMGRSEAHVQNNWDGLVQGLGRRDYDLVMNGLEITGDRSAVVDFSQPYLITGETLTVRREEVVIRGIKDLSGKKVGTLDGSLGVRILKSQAPEAEVLVYDEEVHAYDDLANGRLDAVLLDEPIALYYASPNVKLKNLSPLIGRLEYGIAMPKGNVELQREVNAALKVLVTSGRLREILGRWNLWNEPTAREWKQSFAAPGKPVAYDEYLQQVGRRRTFTERIAQYVGFLPMLAKGAGLTLLISLVSMALAVLVGLLVALSRQYGPRPLALLAASFVEIFRGTPLLIQLYLIFYGLPHIGLRLDPFMAAVIGLGLNYGACEAENYRAGLMSVPKGQMDAAESLGMSRVQSLRYVIVPQAMRLVLPPMTNDFIALLKDSSLVSVITMVELTTIYGQLASTYFDYLGIGILVAGVYFALGLPFVRLARYWEGRLQRAR